MKLKEINKGEEFLFQGHIFSIEIIDNKAKFKFIRKHDGKKKKESKEFVPPTKTEVMSYFFEKGYESLSGATAWEYYNELNWHNKEGKKVTNWKTTMISVWFKPEILRKEKIEDAKPQLIL